MLKMLTICGSLRAKSYNRALIKAFPIVAPSGMTFTDSPSIENIGHYNADAQGIDGYPNSVMQFAEAIANADGVIIASPEYNWTIPGTLKNALDWISRLKDQPFAGKPVAIQSATTGPLGGSRMQYHMRMTLIFLNAFVFGTPEIFVGNAQTKFDPRTLELTDEPTKAMLSQQLFAFADFVQLIKR